MILFFLLVLWESFWGVHWTDSLLSPGDNKQEKKSCTVGPVLKCLEILSSMDLKSLTCLPSDKSSVLAESFSSCWKNTFNTVVNVTHIINICKLRNKKLQNGTFHYSGRKALILKNNWFTSSAASAGLVGFLNIPLNIPPFSWNIKQHEWALWKETVKFIMINSLIRNNKNKEPHLGVLRQTFARWLLLVFNQFVLGNN